MQIDIDLLLAQGAVAKKFNKNEVVFNEDEVSNFYYQIIGGSVRMFNSNDEGKEFTQGLFCLGESFGEPPLFIDQSDPARAIWIQDCTIMKSSKNKFSKFLMNILQFKNHFWFYLPIKFTLNPKIQKKL